jgi:hypothetical protein
MQLKVVIPIDIDFPITSVDNLNKDQIATIEREVRDVFFNGGLEREMILEDSITL